MLIADVVLAHTYTRLSTRCCQRNATPAHAALKTLPRAQWRTVPILTGTSACRSACSSLKSAARTAAGMSAKRYVPKPPLS